MPQLSLKADRPLALRRPFLFSCLKRVTGAAVPLTATAFAPPSRSSAVRQSFRRYGDWLQAFSHLRGNIAAAGVGIVLENSAGDGVPSSRYTTIARPFIFHVSRQYP
jgi:hypothetical protein